MAILRPALLCRQGRSPLARVVKRGREPDEKDDASDEVEEAVFRRPVQPACRVPSRPRRSFLLMGCCVDLRWLRSRRAEGGAAGSPGVVRKRLADVRVAGLSGWRVRE